MAQHQLDKWLVNVMRYSLFTPKMTMDQMKSVLLDMTYSFTTNVSCFTKLNVLSKSKMAGLHPLVYQKEHAVEQAQCEGSVKANALAQKFNAQGVDVAGVSVSQLLAN
jgi:hypothetical protein